MRLFHVIIPPPMFLYSCCFCSPCGWLIACCHANDPNRAVSLISQFRNLQKTVVRFIKTPTAPTARAAQVYAHDVLSTAGRRLSSRAQEANRRVAFVAARKKEQLQEAEKPGRT